MHGGAPFRAELLEGVVQFDERRVRVQCILEVPRALTVVVPGYISFGRPVHVGERGLTFDTLRAVEGLAVALVFDI